VTALVIGGAASGKSAFAESLCAKFPPPRVYIATMQPFDADAPVRIARHRAMRAERGFMTIERYTDVGGAEIPRGASVLLECFGNLTANEMFSGADTDAQGAADAVIGGLFALSEKSANLVMVTNDIFADGGEYDELTRQYIALLSDVNRRAAAMSGEVWEVVCGLPQRLR
jgi:adenosylcobinamide kinase/adenosylcobinamide-phosphate guanylyltransferase